MPNAVYLQDETCSFMMHVTSSNVLGRWVRVSRKDGTGGVMLGTEWQGFHSGIEALVFSVCTSSHWLKTVTIQSLLISRCGVVRGMNL